MLGSKRTAHRWRVFWLFACLSLAATTQADWHNTYPFEATEDLLARADVFESWHSAVVEHAQTRTQLFACAKDRSACRGRMRSFNLMLERAGALTDEEKIELVNYYINRSHYDTDHRSTIRNAAGERIGLQRNHWSSLHNFLIKGGDCEDYASSKYFMLRELGFAAEDLRVVVARSRELRGVHAVLAVRRPDGAIWLLDSDNRIRKRSHRDYRFIYAMNEHYVWDHRDDYLGPGVLTNPEAEVHNETSPADGSSTP